jgi:LEA14-like dessication related protein
MRSVSTKSFHSLFFILCLSLFLSSCRNIQEVQCTGIKGFKISKLDMSGIKGDVMIGIKNPNSFGFSIYRSKFDITYGGVHLGTAKLSRRVHIDGNAERTYPFTLKSDLKNMNMVELMKLMGAGGRGSIEVKGDIKAGKFLVRKKFPIDVKDKISLDR